MALFPGLFQIPKYGKMVRILFALSALILAQLFPLTWLKRSLFDLGKEEERKSVIAGMLYCIAMGFVFWYIDPNKFWYFISAVVAVSVVIGCLIWRLSLKRKKLTVHCSRPPTAASEFGSLSTKSMKWVRFTAVSILCVLVSALSLWVGLNVTD